MAKVLLGDEEQEWKARLDFWKRELQRVKNDRPLSSGPTVIAKVAKGSVLVSKLPGFNDRLVAIQGFIDKYKMKLGIPLEDEKVK